MQEVALRSAIHPPTPVWTHEPSPQAFLPLVFLIVAMIPGLYVWSYGTLQAEQATWGLRGLNVLEGKWRPSEPAPAPPMFAWSMAAALGLPVADKIWLTALPSYGFGLLAVVVIYLLGRCWHTEGTGLLACFLVGLNEVFLRQIQRAEPGTCILFWALLSLLFYVYHLRGQEDPISVWVLAGSGAFAGLLLSAGVFAFWVPVIGLLNLFYLRRQRHHEEIGTSLREILVVPTALGGILVVLVGLVVAGVWAVIAGWSVAPAALWPGVSIAADAPVDSPGSLATAMPATIVLALYGLWRAVWACTKGGAENTRMALPVFWVLIACLALRLTPPTPAVLLFAIVPFTFLAVQTLFAILQREIPDRTVLALMLVSTAVFVISQSPTFLELPSWWDSSAPISAERKLSLHLGIDVLVLTGVGVLCFYRFTARNSRFRRMLFGGFVVLVLVLSWAPGLTRLERVPRAEDAWVKLTGRLRGCRDVDQIVFIGEPSEPLSFAVRVLFPEAVRSRAAGLAELDRIIGQSEGTPLVLLTDPAQQLPRSTSIARGEGTITLVRIYDSESVIVYFPITEADGE